MSVILVIDEQRVFRSGIRGLIEAGVQHSRVVEGSSDLEGFATDQHYDLILVDFGSLSHRLLDWLKTVHERRPATRFAVMSTSKTRADVLNCLTVGFHGFVYKLQSDVDLLAAIIDLLSGRICVPRWLADGDDDRPQTAPSINDQVERLKLTPRQNDILPFIAQGMPNKEICSRLNIAEGTTKIHMAALLRALGARNRTEAAFMAAKLVGSSNRSQDRFEKSRFVINVLSGSADRLRSKRPGFVLTA